MCWSQQGLEDAAGDGLARHEVVHIHAIGARGVADN